MEKQVTFHDLVTHLRMLLESESYSQTTVKDMDFILNSFASYMDKNGLVVYSPEIGERLIQYGRMEQKMVFKNNPDELSLPQEKNPIPDFLR